MNLQSKVTYFSLRKFVQSSMNAFVGGNVVD